MVRITDRFYIDANNNCYTLKEKTTIQDKESENYGKEIYKDLGYYTTLENCLKGILKTVTREFISKAEEKDITELLKEINQQNDFIKSLNVNI